MNGRHKNFEQDLDKAGVWKWETGVQIAALWDIRDELIRLNTLLHCPNFVGIPRKLAAIKKNTTKRKYVRKSKETA